VTEIGGSPRAERISPEAYAAIRRDVAAEMDGCVTGVDRFEIPLVCHVVSGALPDHTPTTWEAALGRLDHNTSVAPIDP